MKNNIIYIGMDVHTSNYTLCAYSAETQKEFGQVQIPPDLEIFKKYMKEKQEELGKDIIFMCGYEAGVLGYSLKREIDSLGYRCVILAPTTMAKSIGERKKKNDRQDAKNIARCLANGTYKEVYMPDSKDDAVKEYIRMRDDLRGNLKRIKQQIIALCVRHGFNYKQGRGVAYWTDKHKQWMNGIRFEEPLLMETLQDYLGEYDHLEEKLEGIDKKIESIAAEKEYAEKVGRLRCFRGIETHTALSLVCETGDFARFRSAEKYAAYLGLVPGEHSSGKNWQLTGITKGGNSHLRRLLTESAQAYTRTMTAKTKHLKAKQKGVEEKYIQYADKGNKRLQKKYYRLQVSGKSGNIAKTAVARELACFIWGMMTEHISCREET